MDVEATDRGLSVTGTVTFIHGAEWISVMVYDAFDIISIYEAGHLFRKELFPNILSVL